MAWTIVSSRPSSGGALACHRDRAPGDFLSRHSKARPKPSERPLRGCGHERRREPPSSTDLIRRHRERIMPAPTREAGDHRCFPGRKADGGGSQRQCGNLFGVHTRTECGWRKRKIPNADTRTWGTLMHADRIGRVERRGSPGAALKCWPGGRPAICVHQRASSCICVLIFLALRRTAHASTVKSEAA